MSRPLIAPGRICLTINALFTPIGTYLADWSETHVLNPRWPPHAKFHNGQTMSFALASGILTLYYTWRSTSTPKESMKTAAIFGSLYSITALSAILYPGALAVDSEFGEGFPQFWIFVSMTGLPWLGYLLELRRLRS